MKKNSPSKAESHRLERISLYPLKLDDIVRDVLSIPPPKEGKRQPFGKRRVRSSQRQQSGMPLSDHP
jgi:hypothetical protein